MLRSQFRSTLTKSIRVARRSYAETAESTSNNMLRLKFALPHETLYDESNVVQVNLPAQSGKIGILANHVPTVEQLTPGVVEIFENAGGKDSKKYYISGGFATVQPDSLLCVTAVEAFALEAFSKEKIADLLSKAKQESTSQDEKAAAKAKIQVNLLEDLQSVLK